MTGHGSFELDLASRSAALGSEYAAMLGYGAIPVREGLDRWFDRCHPADIDPLRRAMDQCASGETGSLHLVVRQRANNGAWQTVRLTAVVVDLDEAGGARRLAGDAADLPDDAPRPAASVDDDARLRSRLEAVHALQANSQAILYALERRHGQLAPVMVSSNVERLLGFTEPEVLDADWWLGHMHQDDREQALTAFANVSTQDTVVHEYRFVRKDGTSVWVQDSSRVVRRDTHGPLEIVGSWTDITDRHEADRALRDRDIRLRLAMRAANQAFWDVVVRNGTPLPEPSPEYALMLGYDPETFCDSPAAWRARTHPDDVEPALTAWTDYIEGRRDSYAVEFRQRTRSGEWAWVHSTGIIIERDTFERPVRVLGLHLNITDRKRAELRAERLSRLNAAFARCNEAIIRSTTESDLFPQLCEIAVRYGGVVMAWIGVADPVSGAVKPIASYGDGRDYLEGITISTSPDDPSGQGPSGTAIRENRAYWVEDFSTNAATAPWHERASRFGWTASGSLPLTRGGRPIGVFTMYARDAEVFDETGRALLTDLAADISYALDTFDLDRRRQQAEAERAEADERYRALFDGNSMPAIVIDPTTVTLVDANQAAVRFYGWDLETLRGMKLSSINAEGAENLRDTLRTVRTDGQALLRVRHRLASGEVRDVEVHATSIVRYRRPLLLGLVVDISAQLVAERALQRAARELAEGQRLANVGSWALYRDGHAQWSDQMYRLFGLTPGAATPTPEQFLERVHPADRAAVLAAFESNLAGNPTSNVLYRFAREDGRFHFIRTSAERRVDPVDGAFVAGVTQDVTDQHDLLERLRIKELAIESALNAMAITDLDGRVTYVNRAFLRLWGFDTLDEVLGRHASEFWADPAEVAAITTTLRERRSWTGELRALSARGTPLELLVSATIVADEHEHALCLLGAFEDLTDRRKAEVSLRSSLREKDALLLEVHHRVKNNLQIMSSLLRLEASRRDSAEVKGVLGDMQNRILSMAVLHELLYRSGDVVEVDLAAYLDALARHVFGSLAPSGRRIDLALTLAPTRVDIDLAVPCGLLVNELLSNSLKHAFPGQAPGTVSVTLSAVEDGMLRLAVSDTGIGLPEELDIARASSLGLQLVTDLARQLRATLEVGPAATGASFTLTFVPRHTSAHPQ